MEYDLIRSNRKTISISISKELRLVIKAPLKITKKDIESLLKKHSHWIEKHKVIMEERVENMKNNALSRDEIEVLKKQARTILPERVEYYSKVMKVAPTAVKITSAATRWGSCSGKNSICFSYRLMIFPIEIIDYVVVHELSHIRHKNHSKAFYNEVALYMPDYKKRVQRLKELQREYEKR